MPPLAINFATVLVLVLPGFLSYRFSVWRSEDPSQRAPLWQLSAMLEHSVYVHLVAVGLIIVAHALVERLFGLDSYAGFLVREGPNEFLDKHFTEAVLWFILYTLYVILASTLIGYYDIPKKISYTVIWVCRIPAEHLSNKVKWLAWLPSPKPLYPQEPVWFYAFNSMSNGYRSKIPNVLVTLKTGDVYYGEMETYPIVLDTESEKDFLIRNALYYPDGDRANEQRLYEFDGIGAVLLNTVNVDSIIVYYEDILTTSPR